VAIQSVIQSLSGAPLSNAPLSNAPRSNALKIPASLLRVAGVETETTSAPEGPIPTSWIDDCQPQDVLFSKPANPEQVRIAQQLARHGSALVQGPPGTGKTHTIANLIGHLLAQG